jgi:hypothetical protein
VPGFSRGIHSAGTHVDSCERPYQIPLFVVDVDLARSSWDWVSDEKTTCTGEPGVAEVHRCIVETAFRN